ncbi:MAG: YbjN domain-containing protein [Corynebacterium sp.]|nr:YbjN domain-containing protein [Corynebacterium sp.]
MNRSLFPELLADTEITFDEGEFSYQWPGELSATDQLKALARASGFNAEWRAPIMVVENATIRGRWSFPTAGNLTAGQARAVVDTLGKGVQALRAELGDPATEFSLDWEADAPAVTYGRIEDWFAQRGVPELPQDETTGALNLSMDGTPIDIHVGEVLSVQVSAQIPDADPASVLHYCNHLNKSNSSAICGVRSGEQWWAIARYSVEARAGLDDAQLDEAIRTGVVTASTKVRDLLRLHRG